MAGETNINSANVSVGKPKASGAIFVAPTGTTLPTDATTALNAAFKSLGYVSEDGVSNDSSISSEDIKDWGGQVVLSVQTEKTDTFKFTLLESKNAEVLKYIYGASNVTVASGGAITVKSTADELSAQALVIEMVLNGDKAKRIAIPNAKIKSTGEISYKAGEAIQYEVTVAALPDTTGATHYEYIS